MFSSEFASPVEYSQSPVALKAISPRSLPKQKFTDEDDQKLRLIVQQLGTKSWTDIAAAMGDRNPRQCKERWENYLDPTINKGPWTKAEDDLLIEKQLQLGSKWVTIARFFNRRTDAQVKNRWQLLDRKMKKQARKQKAQNQATIQNNVNKVNKQQPPVAPRPVVQAIHEVPEFEFFEDYDSSSYDAFESMDMSSNPLDDFLLDFPLI